MKKLLFSIFLISSIAVSAMIIRNVNWYSLPFVSNKVDSFNTKNHVPISCAPPSTILVTISCVLSGPWNNASTWSNGAIPTVADDVTIGAGFTVTLSGSSQANSITVMGTLMPSSPSANFAVITKGIMVMGSAGLLQVGTPSTPYIGIGSFTLTGSNTADVLFTGMGTKVMGSMDGGTIQIEGLEKKSWTTLGVDAAVGATQITLKEPVGWQVGDEIVIVSSRANWNEAEKRTVTAISNANKTVSFSQALAYPHVGTSYNYTRPTDSKTWTADIRAEVGLLSHNIKIQGDASSVSNSFGGHLMVHGTGKAYINNVELYRMGQKSKNGRYPMHWHMLATSGTGQYLKNSSIHLSYNRAVTIHGTHGTLVENNFAYDHIGHGIFLENGSEINNTIKGNVVLLTKRPAPGEQLTPSDNSHDEVQNRTPASYWITNPKNNFENNVAAGTQGTGFWYALAQNFMFESATDTRFNGQTLPYKEVFGGFTGNKAHSCMNGIDIFDRLDANHAILANDSWEEYSPKVFANNTWYANDIGIYSGIGGGRTLASLVTFSNDVFVENYTNSQLASYSTIDQALFVANSGHNLRDGKRFIHRIYDGAGTVKNTHIVGYNANNANFLSNFGASVRHPNASFENLTFDPPLPIRAVSDDYSNTSIVSVLWLTVVKDKTGSLTGTNNATIVSNHPMFLVGDETVPHNWVNLYKTSRSYLHASLYYPGTATLPFLSLTRTKAGTPTASFYEKDNFLGKHQMSLIANDNFLYTYQYESLPSNKRIQMDVTDATIGDSYIARFKDFGKLGALTVMSGGNSLTSHMSLASLIASTAAGFFKETNGDLYIKTYATAQDRTYNIQWTGNFTVPALDTDGDGYTDATEFNTQQNGQLVRNPGNAKDLSFSFKTTTDSWTTAGTVGTTCVGCNNSWEITSNGTDPQIVRTSLNFDANSVTNIFADVKSTPTGSYQLFWTSADEPSFSEDKSIIVPYTASNQRKLINFALQGHPKWTNKTITQLRLDPVGSAGASSVYAIYSETKDTDGDGTADEEELAQCRDFLNASDFGLNYSSPAEGVNAFNQNDIPNLSVSNGIVSGTASAADPYFWSKVSKYGFSGSVIPKLKLRIKTSAATNTQFYWENEDGGFSGTRYFSVYHNAPNVWQEIVIDLSNNPNWVGKTIKNFRIDPTTGSNITFEIDYLRSFDYTECTTNTCEPVTVAVPLLTENNWTYYGKAGTTNYLFAIEHKPSGGNTQNFTASVTLNKICNTPNTTHQVSDLATKEGIFIGGYYWNIAVTSGTINDFVNMRFFPDDAINSNLTTASTTFQNNSSASYLSPSLYFKTNNLLSLPTDIRSDAKGLNYGFSPLIVSSTGSFGGKNYVQFNTITNIATSGGGIIRQVTRRNESSTIDPAQLKGALRYNPTVHKFEGFNGTQWVPLH